MLVGCAVLVGVTNSDPVLFEGVWDGVTVAVVVEDWLALLVWEREADIVDVGV